VNKRIFLRIVTETLFLVSLLVFPTRADDERATTHPAILKSEFLFPLDNKPTPQCHASTLAESQGALVTAWFGGTAEGKPDVGIWLSSHSGNGWSPAREVADGKETAGKQFPCWNPVLFQPTQGPLFLFYKVGPSPSAWWGMLKTSNNGGKTWSPARPLPPEILGPIKNKPVELADGTFLCPTSRENDGWRVHFERSSDGGQTWKATPDVNNGVLFSAIQPTLLQHSAGRLQALCRTQQGHITQVWSEDGGLTWSPMTALDLPNPNSGIDAVTLRDGTFLLVYNHTPRGRSPLNVAISQDGKTWKTALTLEHQPGEYSYPAVIQSADGRVHITYTYQRLDIRHVVVDPAQLREPGNNP